MIDLIFVVIGIAVMILAFRWSSRGLGAYEAREKAGFFETPEDKAVHDAAEKEVTRPEAGWRQEDGMENESK